MAMEYYDSINNSEIYNYYFNKNKKMLTNDEVINVLDKITLEDKQSEVKLKNYLFEDSDSTSNFKIKEKIIFEHETQNFDNIDSINDSKSTTSNSVFNKKLINVSEI